MKKNRPNLDDIFIQQDELHKVPAKKPKATAEISKDMLEEFVYNNIDASVKKILHNIDQHLVKDPFFRINVWTKQTSDNRVVPTTRIAASFFVELLDNDEIIDRTIHAELQSEN